MTSSTLLPVPRRRGGDGTTPICLYLISLLVVPAGVIITKIPISIPPATIVGAGLGLLWLCCQFVDTLGAAKGRTAVRTALFLYLAAHLITFARATAGYLPYDEIKAVDRNIIAIMSAISVAIAVCDGIRGVDGVNRLIKTLVILCTVVSAIGLVQFTTGLDLPVYINLPGLTNPFDHYIHDRGGFRRPAGTVDNPIEFGVLCSMALPLAAHYAFTARARGAGSAHWWLCAGVLAGGAFLAQSRTAMLGVAVALLVAVLAWPRRRATVLLTFVVLFVAAVRIAVPGFVGTLYGLFANLNQDTSISARTRDYAVAGQYIAEHPWFGRGFGTYYSPKYETLDNQYLGTIVENGYVGLAVLLLVFLAAVYSTLTVLHGRRDTEVGSLATAITAGVLTAAVSCATSDLLGYVPVTGVTFLLIGASGALRRATRDAGSSIVGTPERRVEVQQPAS